MPKVKLFNPTDALTKAKDIFWQKGFHATSMQDLIDGMKISRQSLYDTYGNKQDLFDQCLETYQKDAIQLNCSILDASKNTKDIIQDFFDYLVESIVTDNEEKSCFLINTLMESMPENSKSQETITRNFEELENAIFKVLESGKQKKDYNSEFNSLQLTNHFIAATHGIKVVGKVKKEKTVLNDMVKTAMNVLN